MTASPRSVPSGRDLLRALRRRWWLVAATAIVTAVLALAFVFLVTPTFQASTSLRVVEEESVLGGALATAAQSGGGGLSFLASLTGQGVPLQTEMAVLSSRGLLEELVEEMGLRVAVKEPARVPRSSVLAEVHTALDGPEGVLELERQRDGRFRASAEILVGRDPFRVIGAERYERRDLGTVAPGEALEVDGARLVLASEAGSHARIVLRLLPRDEALETLEASLSVTRPQRDADVVAVAVTWSDPEVAADAANRLVARYLAYREEVRVGQARRSADFLTRQLDSLGTELAAAEETLRRFQEARGVVAPETQVSAEVERFAELKGRRDLLAAERQGLSRLIEDLDAGGATSADQRRLAFFPTLLQSQGTAELLRLLGDLEKERTLLLDRRTDDARGVAQLNRRIAGLETEVRRAAETYLQGLDHQVTALDDVLTSFQKELDRVPAVEMAYFRLRRQVELLTELSIFLETRQKEAELNAAQEGVGAYVLARARPPLEPVSPKPALTLALALVLGVVLGAAGAVAVEQAAPSGTD